MTPSKLSFQNILPLLAMIACQPKPSNMDTSEDTGSNEDNQVVVDDMPVWDNIRIEASETLNGIYANDKEIFVVAEEGRSFVNLEGQWQEVHIDAGEEDLNGMWGKGSESTLQMLTIGNSGIVGDWIGGVWQIEDIGTPNLEAIDGDDPTNLIAVGWGGAYSNSTGSWEYMDVDTNPRFNHIWYASESANAIAVGEDSAVGFLADGLWTVSAHDSRKALYGVSGTSMTDIWAVGERGLVTHWDGTAWTDHSVGTSASLWAVTAVSSDNVYVVGNNGMAFQFDGTDWNRLFTGVENNLYAMSITESGAVWAAGNRGIVLRHNPASAE